jgi:hypothetical protein
MNSSHQPKYKTSKSKVNRNGKMQNISAGMSSISNKKNLKHMKSSTFSKSPTTPTATSSHMKMQGKRHSGEVMGKVATPKTTFDHKPSSKPLSFVGIREQRRQERKASNTLSKKLKKLKNNRDAHNAGRPTFQFKIGLQVGTALGDCYLQVQKLENSMDKVVTVSEDISDVLSYLHENNIGNQESDYQPQSKHFKNMQENKHRRSNNNSINDPNSPLVENPLEEVSILNENLIDWQRDSLLRMQAMTTSVRNLQTKLEELDAHHTHAQNIARSATRNRDIDEAYRTISELQNEMYKTKMLLQDKNLEIQRLKQRPKPTTSEELDQREKELERKEKELDHDAELIATQSEELRKESNRLLAEREEVRKMKENWTNMIQEVKDQQSKLDKRDAEVNGNHQKLFDLHETLQEEKKKLHRKAKKIKSREKRLNQLRNANSSYVQGSFGSQGSDYPESELTYFSDGDTVCESVNSISDDESQDNYHKQQMQANNHLGIPDHGHY